MESSLISDEDTASEGEVLATVGRMIANLARCDALERGDLASALGQLTEAGAAALRVERSSVWRFDPAGGKLNCLDLFERKLARHSSGESLVASMAPSYFQVLVGQRTIAASAARTDPRTREFEESYLIPHGISAKLSAPISLSGELVGVLCLEHVGGPRTWQPWEELVADMLAHLASLVLGSSDRIRETRELAEYGSKLESLVEERTRSLRQEQQFLQTVFATAPFGMAFFDREHRLLRINGWLAGLRRLGPEEALGKTPAETLRREPALATKVENMLTGVFTSGRPGEPFEVTSDAEERSFFVSGYPIVTDGVVTQVCCLVVDVSAQRRGERERARLLERERAAREEAEAANRAKDEFLAMLGHELRNPLAPIQTALHLMRRLGDVAGKERAVMERQVHHLSRLVDDMLDVARITSGKLELRLQPIELSHAVARALELSLPIFEKHGHFLEVDVPCEGLLVHGDLDRLAQVVSNLLTNAAKFTPSGGRVKISARAGVENHELVVSDTGEGIHPELLPKLFEAFVQGGWTLDRSRGGLGLGLSIVLGIVKAHGGAVSVHSEGSGRGSEFSVRLPTFAPHGQDFENSTESRLRAAPKIKRRILIVDDNRDAAELLANLLASLGHETVTAFDAPSALLLARELLPEVALLDLGLPVMDGFELAVRLKKLPELHSIRLIALTGYSRPQDRERSRAAKFDEHLIKPVDIAELEGLLTSLFQAESAAS